MNALKIDVGLFVTILPDPTRQNRLVMQANASGHVSLSKNLRTQIQWDKVLFLTNAGGDVILLKKHTDEAAYYRIPNSNSISALPFTRELVKRGIPLPASYKMSWNHEIGMWVGTLIKDPSREPRTRKPAGKRMPKLDDLV